MAVYTPDHDYIEGKKIVDSLNPMIEKERLILYYIQKQQEFLDRQDKRIVEYQKFFDLLNNLLPNNNPRVY